MTHHSRRNLFRHFLADKLLDDKAVTKAFRLCHVASCTNKSLKASIAHFMLANQKRRESHLPRKREIRRRSAESQGSVVDELRECLASQASAVQQLQRKLPRNRSTHAIICPTSMLELCDLVKDVLSGYESRLTCNFPIFARLPVDKSAARLASCYSQSSAALALIFYPPIRYSFACYSLIYSLLTCSAPMPYSRSCQSHV